MTTKNEQNGMVDFAAFLIGGWIKKLFQLFPQQAELNQLHKENQRLEKEKEVLEHAVSEASNQTKTMINAHARARNEIIKLEGLLKKLAASHERDQEVIARATTTILELTKERDHLKEIAFLDELTGILNLRGIKIAMQREAGLIGHTLRQIEKQHPDIVLEMPEMYVIFLDLDGFKVLNDEMQLHKEGDRALAAFAKKLLEVFRRRGSDIVGRKGGDEFLVIIQEDEKGALELAEKLRREIEADHTFLFADGALRITTSIGVAKVHLDSEHLNNLEVEAAIDRAINAADGALYVSKAKGRNRVSLAKEIEDILG